MPFNIGDRVIVVADYFTNGEDALIGKVGTVAKKGYQAVKPFDYGVRLDEPMVKYMCDDDATGFDENELALYDG